MKRLIYILLPIAILGAMIGYSQYNKQHKDMESVATDLAISAFDIFGEFENNEAVANKKYLDKVIAVTGTISTIEEAEDGVLKISLEAGGDFGGVICQTQPEASKSDFQVGSEVTMKGKCTGVLMDVIFVRCVLVK